MTEAEQKQLDAIVDKFLDDASEFSDSVRIFTTKFDGGSGNETSAQSDGRGNYYAQVGQIREWLIRQDELVRVHSRNTAGNDEDKND